MRAAVGTAPARPPVRLIADQGARSVDDVPMMAQQLQEASARLRQAEAALAERDRRLRELEQALSQREARLEELERRCKATAAESAARAPSPAPTPDAPPAPSSRTPTLDASPVTSEPELEETLRRLVTKIAMILQAEKCVFLLHDQRTPSCLARRGLRRTVHAIHVPDSGALPAPSSVRQGVVVDRLDTDAYAGEWAVQLVEARNCASVPLVIEARRGTASWAQTSGVLHVFESTIAGLRRRTSICWGAGA